MEVSWNLNSRSIPYFTAVAQIEHLDDVTVFSDGEGDSVGLSFLIDVDFTYFLQEDKIGALHKELSKGYPEVVLSRTNDAIKNCIASF